MSARIFLFVLTAAVALAAEPEVELLGAVDGNPAQVSLKDNATGRTQWVSVGKAFGDYVVTAYEAAKETVVLTKDGRQIRVQMNESKVKSGGGGVEPSPEHYKTIMNNLRMLAAAADQVYLENGKDHASYDEIVGPTKYVKQVVAVEGEDYRKIVFKQGTPLSVTTAGGFVVTYDF